MAPSSPPYSRTCGQAPRLAASSLAPVILSNLLPWSRPLTIRSIRTTTRWEAEYDFLDRGCTKRNPEAGNRAGRAALNSVT
jgi:hypothetical protein